MSKFEKINERIIKKLEQIEKTEDKLKKYKDQLKDLEEQKEALKVEDLLATIKEKGLNIDEAKQILGNKETEKPEIKEDYSRNKEKNTF